LPTDRRNDVKGPGPSPKDRDQNDFFFPCDRERTYLVFFQKVTLYGDPIES